METNQQTTTTMENPNEKTHGEPCAWCGCPYPGDHARDCQWGLIQAAMRPEIAKIEGYICQLADLVNKVATVQGETLQTISKLLDVLGAPTIKK